MPTSSDKNLTVDTDSDPEPRNRVVFKPTIDGEMPSKQTEHLHRPNCRKRDEQCRRILLSQCHLLLLLLLL